MAYSNKSVKFAVIAGVFIASIIIASTNIYFTYGSGSLSILVTDPPEWGDVTQVYIKIGKMEIHKAGAEEDSGWITIMEEEKILNLTDVLDTPAVLGETNLQAGKYNIIRFEIINANVTVNGINETADVPSGKLKISIIRGGVTIEANQNSKLLLDIETRIIYSKGKGYKLVPAAKALPINNNGD